MKKKYQLGWIIAVVAMTVLACTCGNLSQATSQLETAQAVASQIATSGVVETMQAGGTSEGGGQVTFGNVPENIPVMDNPKNLVAAGGAVSYSVAADLATVKAFYQKEMEAKGWTEEQPAAEITGVSVAMIYINDTQRASIGLTAQGGDTQVGIGVSSK